MEDKVRILLVEDDKFLRELMLRKLREYQNFDVSFAVDGESGWMKAQGERPDIVLLDLILPGSMKGFDVLQKIQEENLYSGGMAVVVLSNLGQQEEVDRAKRLGAVDFLVKAHHTPEEVVERIINLAREKGLIK